MLKNRDKRCNFEKVFYLCRVIKQVNNKQMTTAAQSKKVTMATLKSFIKKSDKLFVEELSSFDGMTDCVQSIKEPKLIEVSKENAIGIKGVWCVGQSRDDMKYVETSTMIGIEVYNCCGCGILWTKKQ